jgi:hypothetical protein
MQICKIQPAVPNQIMFQLRAALYTPSWQIALAEAVSFCARWMDYFFVGCRRARELDLWTEHSLLLLLLALPPRNKNKQIAAL